MKTFVTVVLFLAVSVAAFCAEPVQGKLYFKLYQGSQPAWDIYTIKDQERDVRGQGSFLFVTHYIEGRGTPITLIYPVHAVISTFFVPDQADEATVSRLKQMGVPIK